MLKKISLSIISALIFLSSNIVYAISSDFLITSDSIGKVKLGTPKNTVKKLYKGFKINDNGSNLDVLDNKNNTLINMYFNKFNNVSFIKTCSEEYLTKEGIVSNMSLKTLSKIYPNMEISLDGEQGSEQFFPKNYSTKTSVMEIALQSNVGIGSSLGKYSKTNITKNFSTNGKIECIYIFSK